MFLRRALLIVLVLAALAAVLQGCAEYEIRQPMAERGTVTLTWIVDPARVPGSHCGWASEIAQDHYLVIFRKPYDFNHVCWAHELAHLMGARH